MEAITSSVACLNQLYLKKGLRKPLTLGEDKFAAVQLDVIDTVKNLKEEVHKWNRVSCRADSIVQVRHVFNMAIVGLVQIFTVPAGLEMYLGS